MALNFTSSGGIFPVLGWVGTLLRDMRSFQTGTFQPDASQLLNQLGTEATVAAQLATGLESGLSGVVTYASTLQTFAKDFVNRKVYEDNAQSSRSDISISLAEVIRQMKLYGVTVKACTVQSFVTASSTASSTNTGTGVLVLGTKRGDGLVNENIFAETATVLCTADSQSGGATAGNESFSFVGDVAQTNVFHWEWPLGSGANTSLSAVDGSQSNSTGNLLNNSGFETWTVANTPDQWSILTGTAGTTVLQGSGVALSGSSSLEIVGNGSENTALAQTFNNSTSGTVDTLLPETVYHVSLWALADFPPAAGVLTVDLVDGSNVTTTDAQSVSNSFTCDLTRVGASTWVNFSGEFRTPAVLPSTYKLRLRLSTPLTSGRKLYLDNVAVAQATQLYSGGPFATVFSGGTAFILNDAWTVQLTNNRGGAANLATFQTIFDRLFNMRSLDLLLPSSASPTVADSSYIGSFASLDFSQASNSMYLPGRP